MAEMHRENHQSTKMHCCTFILFNFLLFQNVFSKEIIKIHNDRGDVENVLKPKAFVNNFMIAKYTDQRSIKDVWNSIKNTANKAWISLKNLAQNTKEKVKVWIQDVKDRAATIIKIFEERLKNFEAKINSIIQSLLENEYFKKCLKEENEEMKKKLLDILQHVKTCIADKIKGLATLEDNSMIDAVLNDTKFIKEIDMRLSTCNQEKEEIEECLQKVREDILKETEKTEEELLKSRLLSRNFADDILEAVVSCSTNGLIEASSVITRVVLKIIVCTAENHPEI